MSTLKRQDEFLRMPSAAAEAGDGAPARADNASAASSPAADAAPGRAGLDDTFILRAHSEGTRWREARASRPYLYAAAAAMAVALLLALAFLLGRYFPAG